MNALVPKSDVVYNSKTGQYENKPVDDDIAENTND